MCSFPTRKQFLSELQAGNEIILMSNQTLKVLHVKFIFAQWLITFTGYFTCFKLILTSQKVHASAIVIFVGDQKTDSWKRLRQEYSGSKAGSGARYHSFYQAEWSRNCPECPFTGRSVFTLHKLLTNIPSQESLPNYSDSDVLCFVHQSAWFELDLGSRKLKPNNFYFLLFCYFILQCVICGCPK